MTVDTSWDLIDADGTKTMDGLLASEVPDVIVGETVTLQFYVDPSSPNTADFDAFDKYVEFVNDKSTDFATTYDGTPWYRFSTYPGTNISSYLFEVRPTERVDLYDFWALLVEAEDNSRFPGPGGRLQLTFFVLAEAEDYTRTEVVNEFKADL